MMIKGQKDLSLEEVALMERSFTTRHQVVMGAKNLRGNRFWRHLSLSP